MRLMPNMAFERNAPKAARPSTLRYTAAVSVVDMLYMV